MSAADLLRQPLWDQASLGRPLPESPHAVSVSLPRWRDVVRYEERCPQVVDRLACGYPRFVIHPLVRQAADRLGAGEPCLTFPTAASAAAAEAFVRRHPGVATRRVSRGGLHAVITTEDGYVALRSFWQHTGLIVSSRQAEAFLRGADDRGDAGPVRADLKASLAGLYGCEPDDVFLTPSGMAAQYEALRAVAGRRPGARTAQLGFPYVDTLKLQERLGPGCVLLHNLATLEKELEHQLGRETLAACFAEVPGNPLLGSADLPRITPILRRHGVPLVADDVVATPINVDLGGYADLVATSLTKYVVGTGEAMGGAVICNPRSPYYRELNDRLTAGRDAELWGDDAAVILEQARSFPERMERHNRNGRLIAERLRAHPTVERVWYPKWEFVEVYDAVRRPEGGWGSLITFLPRNAPERSPQVYDRMEVCKGPSLGTVFTLACPFTLLAHYTELDWAEACGVSRHLIRISVGLEDPDELWTRIARGLAE